MFDCCLKIEVGEVSRLVLDRQRLMGFVLGRLRSEKTMSFSELALTAKLPDL